MFTALERPLFDQYQPVPYNYSQDLNFLLTNLSCSRGHRDTCAAGDMHAQTWVSNKHKFSNLRNIMVIENHTHLINPSSRSEFPIACSDVSLLR